LDLGCVSRNEGVPVGANLQPKHTGRNTGCREQCDRHHQLGKTNGEAIESRQTPFYYY
jgi:hypothetical protein